MTPTPLPRGPAMSVTDRVVRLDDYRPHRAEMVLCGHCGTRWSANFPADHRGRFECPYCRRMAGYVEPQPDPDSAA